jgi:hypothetical protein
MSIQQNFPAISPSLSLNFARSKTLDPRITFTRTSSGTRTNETGLVEVVPANSPRFDHSYDPVSGSVRSLGLLVEESRSNSLLWSEDFSNWTVTNGSVQSNVITAPDGNVTADKLVENSSTGNKEVNRGSITFTSGTSLTYSCFVKASERSLFRLAATSAFFGSGSSGTNAYFDLTSGTVYSITGGVTSASIIPYPNGWYRCIATILPTSSGTGNVFITLILSGVTSNYTGDGTSGIYIWGAQLEQGSFPTSYIPTSASTVTRTADNASITGSNFSDFYNSEQGTIICFGKSNPYDTDTSVNVRRGLVTLFEGLQTGHSINLRIDTGDVDTYSRVIGFGGIDRRFSHTLGNNFKSAASYTRSDLSFSVDGRPTISISSIENLTSNPNQLVIGRQVLGGSSTGTRYPNTTISQITYYPSRLPNAQLQNLTK